jgi:hypothetical protein
MVLIDKRIAFAIMEHGPIRAGHFRSIHHMLSLKELFQDQEPRRSRNRNYELYDNAVGKSLMFSFHLINSLSRDIERAGLENCSLNAAGEKYCIKITNHSLSYRREAVLSDDECEVLQMAFPSLK